MAEPLFIGATPQSSISQSNTPTNVPVPAGAQVGDLLILLATPPQNSNSDLVLPAGWTVIVRNPADIFRDSLIVAAGIHTGGATYPVACPTTFPRVRTLCYRDVAQTPITASAIKLVQNAEPNRSTALSVSQPNSIELVIACNLDQQSISVTGPTGMASRINSATFVSLSASDASVSVGSTPERTVVFGNSTKRAIANLVIAGTGGGDTPVAFSGTVNDQTATVGTAFNLAVASRFSGPLTPLTYSLVAGSLTGTGLSLNTSTGDITGTPTGVGAISGLQVGVTDAGNNVAQTNSFTITVSAAAQVPQSAPTVGGAITTTTTTASAPYSYSASDQTGFQYRLNGGAAMIASASPINLTGLTEGTPYTFEVRAINAAGAGAWSAVANFRTKDEGTIIADAASPIDLTGLLAGTEYSIQVRAVNAAGVGAWSSIAKFMTDEDGVAPAVPPAGTSSIGNVSVTTTTASVPYSYSASDQTGFEYRLNGGAATAASASPINLTGLTAGEPYTLEVRAINAAGTGAWSAVKSFTTTAIVLGTFTLTKIAENDDIRWSLAAVDVVTVMTTALNSIVVVKTGLTTTADGSLVFSDALITPGTEYFLLIKIGTAYGWHKAVAA